jgi:hypothetical protein
MSFSSDLFLCSLQRVYKNPDAVDDALVDLIHTPSGDFKILNPAFAGHGASI